MSIEAITTTPVIRQLPPRRAAWLPAGAAAFAVAWGGNQFTPLIGPYESLGWNQATVNLMLFAYAGGIIPALFLAPLIGRRVSQGLANLCGVLVSLLGSVLLVLGSQSLVLLISGRILVGAALGHGMVSATAWLQHLMLHQRPATTRLLTASARATSLSLTAGFGLGAAVAGVLAQVLPSPLKVAYLPHLAVSGAAIIIIARARGNATAPQP